MTQDYEVTPPSFPTSGTATGTGTNYTEGLLSLAVGNYYGLLLKTDGSLFLDQTNLVNSDGTPPNQTFRDRNLRCGCDFCGFKHGATSKRTGALGDGSE